MGIRQRDINSAYPWACTRLPCLVHGEWRQTRRPPEGGTYVGLYSFTHPNRRGLHHLPVRSKTGSISFPRYGEGWYWGVEVEAARRAGATVSLVGRAWVLDVRCRCDPFGFMHQLYRDRKRLGKSGRGLVVKLATNSVYGVLAQSVGMAPYANPVWAGLITAITRARLIDDYVVCGERACVMLATDGVFYADNLMDGVPGGVGGGLGEWDEKVHEEGMFIIQPGLYFVSSELGKPKTRGVPQSAVAERRVEFESAWDTALDNGTPMGASVMVPVRQFIGLRLAYARGKPHTAGEWVVAPKSVGFGWGNKRVPHRRYRDGAGIRTFPAIGAPGVRTVPYGRMIGGNLVRDMERLEFDDSPDWAETMEVEHG